MRKKKEEAKLEYYSPERLIKIWETLFFYFKKQKLTINKGERISKSQICPSLRVGMYIKNGGSQEIQLQKSRKV